MSGWVPIPADAKPEDLIRLINQRCRNLSFGDGGGTTVVSRNSTTVIGGSPSIDPWYSITFATPFTVDQANGRNQMITLTGDAVLADPVGWADGEELVLRLKQDGTGGRTVTRATPAKWELPDGFMLYGLANRIITLNYVFESTGVALLKNIIQI